MEMSRKCIGVFVGVALSALHATPGLAVSHGEIEKANREKRALQRELDTTVSSYQKATTSFEAMEKKAAKAKQRLNESLLRLKSSQSRLNARANSMYRRGHVSFLQILLDTRSLSEFERKMTLLEVSSSRDSSDMIKAARARADVDEQQGALVAARDEQRKLVARLRGETRELTAKFRRAQALEDRLRSDRATRSLLERQAASRTEKAVARLREQAAKNPLTTVIPFGSGALRCMIGGPHSFTDTYGASRSGGRSHQGVDIFAAQGTPVLAIVDGVVSRNSSSRGGLSLYLRGSNGSTYFYAHLSGYSDVSSGQRVGAGTRVGYVGNTGASWAAPHLHFEVHPRGGAPINPYPTARAACG